MTSLRKTRPTSRAIVYGWVLLAFGVAGCGAASLPTADDASPVATASPGANDPAWLTSRGRLPAPDTDRIEYDARTRTLTFSDLPGRDRWMVQLPDEASGRQVGRQHHLPEGVDTSRTLVYYARPGSRVSVAVTVRAIEDCRAPHTSQVVNR